MGETGLRERLIEALNMAYEPLPIADPHPDLVKSQRHDGHGFMGACYVCRGDVAELADVMLGVVGTWRGLMSLLDEHYPPEVFDGSSGDEGPRIVALTREIDRLQHEIMGYQSPGGEYDQGHEHGSDVAAKFRAERDRERSSRQAWAEEADYLQHLLEQFVDRDPCWFDHHGGCQAHGFLDLEPGQLCPQEEARRALDDGLVDHMPRVCACVTDEHAAALPPGFSRPVCAVHPGVWSQAEVDGIKERAAARLARLEPYIESPVPRVTSSPVEEPYHYQDVEQTVLDVGGDPLSATPWADPEYKGGEVE